GFEKSFGIATAVFIPAVEIRAQPFHLFAALYHSPASGQSSRNPDVIGVQEGNPFCRRGRNTQVAGSRRAHPSWIIEYAHQGIRGLPIRKLLESIGVVTVVIDDDDLNRIAEAVLFQDRFNRVAQIYPV